MSTIMTPSMATTTTTITTISMERRASIIITTITRPLTMRITASPTTTTTSTATPMRRWITRYVPSEPIANALMGLSVAPSPSSQGSFAKREQPLKRDYLERAFTVGIGGPVGSG
jgi:hypothetical protein